MINPQLGNVKKCSADDEVTVERRRLSLANTDDTPKNQQTRSVGRLVNSLS